MTSQESHIIYIKTYYDSQKKANKKYYDDNKTAIIEKRANKFIALKEDPEQYEKYLLRKRGYNNKRALKLKQQNEQQASEIKEINENEDKV